MSGWIKMGTGLRRHPKVVRISSALDADRLRIIGAMHVVWCLFDEHSKDGKLFGYTPAVLDEELGWPGFSAAMQEVGWLEVFEGFLSVPSYEEHNGPTAKRRATDAQRKGKVRKSSAECPQDVRNESGQMSACDADKTRNREEKRREEKNTPLPPAGVKRDGPVGLKAWMSEVKAKGEKPIQEGDPVFDYAAEVGIPDDFMALAWVEFRHRYTQPGAKRYRDWRAVFRKAIRGNWLKLWFVAPDGSYQLTTVGHQAQRAHNGGKAA